MPYSTTVKERAYEIDPDCWVSYSGCERRHKAYMERRRGAALQQAADEARASQQPVTQEEEIEKEQNR